MLDGVIGLVGNQGDGKTLVSLEPSWIGGLVEVFVCTRPGSSFDPLGSGARVVRNQAPDVSCACLMESLALLGPKGIEKDPRGPKGNQGTQRYPRGIKGTQGTQGRLRRPWGDGPFGVIPKPFRMESHFEQRVFMKGSQLLNESRG